MTARGDRDNRGSRPVVVDPRREIVELVGPTREVVELTDPRREIVEIVEEVTQTVFREPFVYSQETPSDTWIVPHNLGRRPVAWSLYDDNDDERIEYTVTHLEVNRCKVTHDIPVAGKFYCI